MCSSDLDDVIERLDKGLIDAGLLIGPKRHDKYDYLSLEKTETIGLLMPKDSPLAEKIAVTLDDVKGLPLIFPNQSFNGYELVDWFGKIYESLNIVASYNLIYNATHMVEDGIGYAFALEGIVDTTGTRQLTIRPFEPALKAGLYIVTKRYQAFSPAAKVFLNRLREAL